MSINGVVDRIAPALPVSCRWPCTRERAIRTTRRTSSAVKAGRMRLRSPAAFASAQAIAAAFVPEPSAGAGGATSGVPAHHNRSPQVAQVHEQRACWRRVRRTPRGARAPHRRDCPSSARCTSSWRRTRPLISAGSRTPRLCSTEPSRRDACRAMGDCAPRRQQLPARRVLRAGCPSTRASTSA